MVTIPTVTLNDGATFPELGLGTYNLRGEDGTAAIVSAIENGYRLLDSAVNYENEAEVGEAVRRSGIRDELIVTTKIPGRDHGYDEAIRSAEGSLERLGLDRIDLYLIHWPNPSVDRYVDTFRAMIALRENESLAKSVGVDVTRYLVLAAITSAAIAGAAGAPGPGARPPVGTPAGPAGAGPRVTVGVRPEHLRVVDSGGWPLQVETVEMLGAERLIYGHLGGARGPWTILRMHETEAPPASGQTLHVVPLEDRVHGFDAASGRRIES